jgi:hypothetical protein
MNAPRPCTDFSRKYYFWKTFLWSKFLRKQISMISENCFARVYYLNTSKHFYRATHPYKFLVVV